MSDSGSDNEEKNVFESEQNDDYDSYNNASHHAPPDIRNIDDVVDLDVDPLDAFAKFAGTYHDTTNNDFTGKASASTKPRTETVFVEPSRFEPPYEKIARVEREIKEFQAELEAMGNVPGVQEMSDKLAKECKALKSEFNLLKLSKKYAYLLQKHYPLKEEQLHTKNISGNLKKKIQNMQSKKEEKKEPEEASGICYEFYQAKAAKAHTAKSAAVLEKRLAKLEETIGQPSKSIFPDVRTTVIYVGKKLDSLNDKQLKDLQTKMDYLSRELKNLEKKKEKLASAKQSEYQKKIKELYGLMASWDEANNTAPIVIRRLESIKAMVNAGKDSKQQLSTVVDTKNKLGVLLDENVATLKKTRTQFRKSMQQVKGVCQLEKDFEDLARKMQKHFG